MQLVRWLLVCGATFATGALGFALPHFGARLALPLLPSGIAVAALVRWGRGLWSAVLVAEIAIDLVNGSSVPVALMVGTGLPAGAWVTAALLERYRFDPAFGRAGDVPLFFVATLAGMTLPATVGNLSYVLFAPSEAGAFAVGWLRWWSNTVAGVLVLAPLLIVAGRASFASLRGRPLTATLYVAGLLLVSLGDLLLAPGPELAGLLRPPLFVLSLLLIVVGALRFGLAVAAASSFALSVLAALSFAFDGGAFHGTEQLYGLVVVWSYAGALTGTGLVVTALLAERDAAAVERLRAERRYAQVFEASPQPLWVHDPATLRFLLVNRATERQYGYDRDELLERSVATLAAPGEEHALPGPDEAAPHADHLPFETRHVTRDGRVIEIEMWTRPIDFGGRPAVLVFAADVTERKELGRALIDAIAGEQRRIGQEMHDGLGQELTGLSLSARALANRASRERLPFAAELEQLAALILRCIQSARRIVHGLSPLAGADGNLVAALTALAEASAASDLEVRVTTRLDAPLTLPLEARNHLFRIAQEALQNAQKHAAARRVDIELSVRPGLVRLAVLDDGRGLPAALPSGGLGMRTMRYRAASFGGRLTIRSHQPRGTAVVCEFPQPAPAATARSA